MERIRLKKAKIFSELLSVFDEEKQLYMFVEKWDNHDYFKNIREYLTQTQYQVVKKVFRYKGKDRPFQRGRFEEVENKIKTTFEKAEYIVKSMCLEEVEFVELNKEDFETWKTFREWMEKCDVQNKA